MVRFDSLLTDGQEDMFTVFHKAGQANFRFNIWPRNQFLRSDSCNSDSQTLPMSLYSRVFLLIHFHVSMKADGLLAKVYICF